MIHWTLGRRTAFLLTSPGRLLFHWSWPGLLIQCLYLCEKLCNHLWCSSGSRKTHFDPASCCDPLPSCPFLCRPLLWKLFRSIPPPSNSALSTPPYTTPVSSGQTSPVGRGKAVLSIVWLLCFPLTEKDLCVQFLDPE